MKFHALLPVRDEADIIAQSLQHLLAWADAVYVFDTGSLDQTWDIVQHFASIDRRVVPLKKEAVFFSDKRLRAWIFNQARCRMSPGDWFLRADADEFHEVAPPEFVRTRMRRHETAAYHQYYDFRLTCSEAKAWEWGQETLADRNRPIEDRRRWFTVNSYTEPRLCRYRESMQWPEGVSFPYNAGYIARERLPIRHYPHRDPMQLARRCRLRAIMMADPELACSRHWAEADWRRQVVPENLPGLQYWQPGTELPQPRFTNHLAPLPKRALQRLVHACCLPLLDRFRPGYTKAGRLKP
ncbi:MAG TPA: glycosyltransferase family 2 protein, partial [Chthonomonadales bacterium]|nr:glycosyltransferase family 2 protein [Chthonomonadales bacterium]